MKIVLRESLKSAWIIIKLVIPIYILSDILYYYNLLSYISFIFEPITSILNLPKESAVAVISGVFLNLYAAIAFASPLNLSSYEWTILAVFLGISHSLIVENSIMKKLGISTFYSYFLRIGVGLGVGYLVSLLPKELFGGSLVSEFKRVSYSSVSEMLTNSLLNATILTLKIIFLITILIIVMNYIKSLKFFKDKSLSKSFSIGVGLLLGITYGAGVLMSQMRDLKRDDIFFIGTFLMIAHSLIEDTLLFTIFGANFFIVVLVRLIFATFFAYLFSYLSKRYILNF